MLYYQVMSPIEINSLLIGNLSFNLQTNERFIQNEKVAFIFLVSYDQAFTKGTKAKKSTRTLETFTLLDPSILKSNQTFHNRKEELI